MTDKSDGFWNDFDHLPEGIRNLAEEVAAMSDEDVADFIVEHDLAYLVTDQRVDDMLDEALAAVAARRRTTH